VLETTLQKATDSQLPRSATSTPKKLAEVYP